MRTTVIIFTDFYHYRFAFHETTPMPNLYIDQEEGYISLSNAGQWNSSVDSVTFIVNVTRPDRPNGKSDIHRLPEIRRSRRTCPTIFENV